MIAKMRRIAEIEGEDYWLRVVLEKRELMKHSLRHSPKFPLSREDINRGHMQNKACRKFYAIRYSPGTATVWQIKEQGQIIKLKTGSGLFRQSI